MADEMPMSGFALNPTVVPVRFSRLKRFASSPAHYFEAVRRDHVLASADEDAIAALEDDDTAAKRMGRLAHTLVLGGKLCVYPTDRRGKAWQEFKAAHPREDIVTLKEYARATRMADALARHSDAMALLTGEAEVEIAWRYCGRACGSRLDVIGDRFITDLKATSCSSPSWFTRHALSLYYHAQLAFYRGAAVSTGRRISTAYNVAVELAPPHVVTAFELTPRALEVGEKLCRLWMEQLLACEAAAEWPGYVQSVIDLDVPEPDPELIFEEDEVA